MRASERDNFIRFSERSVWFRPLPPRRRSKSPFESKLIVRRITLLNFCTAEPDSAPELLALRAVSMSKYLYAKYVMSSFELLKGYVNPLSDRSKALIPTKL